MIIPVGPAALAAIAVDHMPASRRPLAGRLLVLSPEATGQNGTVPAEWLRLAIAHVDQLQLLRVSRADGDDHPSAFGRLLDQRRRHLGSGGGNDDRVIGRAWRKAETAVARNHFHVAVAEAGEQCSGFVGQGGMALDGDDLRREFGEQRGHVTRSGADFQHFVAGSERQGFEHERDDVGLRDCLALADG